jgi:hypothetical protein
VPVLRRPTKGSTHTCRLRSAFTEAAVPCRCRPCSRYTLQGTITEENLDAASAGPDPSPVSLKGPSGAQTATHLLYLTVIGFP